MGRVKLLSHPGAFSGPKTRPAAVAEQTGRLTWIFFVMFDESVVETGMLLSGNATSLPVPEGTKQKWTTAWGDVFIWKR